MGSLFRLAFALLLLPAITGCDDDVDLKVMTLTPSALETFSASRHDQATFSCFPGTCAHTHSTSCQEEIPGGAILSGFSNRYDSGTSPCNCWWWVDCAYRGAVKFDLTPLKGRGIGSAMLKWDMSSVSWSGSSASNTFCGMSVWVAGRRWDEVDEIYLGGNELASYPKGATEPSALDISTLVRDWASGDQENMGLYFKGPDESFRSKNNDRCMHDISNLRLEVLYSEKKT